jgi:hypothetical protein
MIGLFCFALAVLASPFTSKSRLEHCSYFATIFALSLSETLSGWRLTAAMRLFNEGSLQAHWLGG